ncbi:hypothetical protein MTO96_046628, partial [Rhipicephalus appendiculatus]
THVWLLGTSRGLYRELASTDVPGPSAFVSAPAAAVPQNDTFGIPAGGSPSCAQCPAEETVEQILLQCPDYDDQRRKLFDLYVVWDFHT